MAKPWLKFYPSDWRADPMLRMCSIGARGLWMEMLCLMHEAGGYLRVNGTALDLEQLARLAGIPHRKCTVLVAELQKNGVFSVAENGEIFSRRILKDLANAKRDQENGRLGGNPKLIEGVNPPDKSSRARVPDTRSQKEEEGERALARARPPKFEMKEDWVPDAEQRALALKHGFSEEETDALGFTHRAYWRALDDAVFTEEQWRSFWRNLVLREKKRKGGKQAPEPTGPARRRPDETPLDRAQRLAREENLAVERAADNMTEPNHVGYLTLLAPPGRA